MQLLVGFLLAATVYGMFARSFDWRTIALFAAAASIVTGIYYLNAGVW